MKRKTTHTSIGVNLVFFFLTTNTYAQQLTQQFTFSTNNEKLCQKDGYKPVAVR